MNNPALSRPVPSRGLNTRFLVPLCVARRSPTLPQPVHRRVGGERSPDIRREASGAETIAWETASLETAARACAWSLMPEGRATLEVCVAGYDLSRRTGECVAKKKL